MDSDGKERKGAISSPVLIQGAVPKQKSCKGSKHLLQLAAKDEEKSKTISSSSLKETHNIHGKNLFWGRNCKVNVCLVFDQLN